MKEKINLNIDKITDAKIIQRNLILSALYLATFELLKSSIIEEIKSFFTNGYKNGKFLVDPEYKQDVRWLDRKDVFNASCLWLIKMDVITKDEAEKLKVIREHRNEIAHELPRLLIDSDLEVNISYLRTIVEMIHKIDIWWIRVDMDVMQEMDIDRLKDENIKSGRMIMLGYILEKALDIK